MNLELAPSWKKYLENECSKEYFINLLSFLDNEYAISKCYPISSEIFNCFEKCSFQETKVVILGQDPYHGAGQANGLCFSVNENCPFPPSLTNIFKELKKDLGIQLPSNGNLERWATQGILLLNATLTVKSNEAGSHQKKGWEVFTDAVIHLLNNEKQNLVFLLWGNYAQNKGKFIDQKKHLVLKAKHPSPLSANQGGWFGEKHFSKTNNYLEIHNLGKINW